MKYILSTIENKKKALFNNPFCLFIKHQHIPSDQKIIFIPSIFEIVIGFRNFIDLITIENPKNELESLLYIHCKEDDGHWKWYLSDLELLNFNSAFTLSDFGNFISNENSNQIRAIFKLAIKYALQSNDPLKTFVVLEVLEAGFVAFITHMLIPIKDLGLYEKLKYFGKTHFEAESNHQSGSWVDQSVHDKLSNYDLSKSDRLEAVSLVDKMFEEMNKMFLNWRVQIHSDSKLNFYKERVPDRRVVCGGDRREVNSTEFTKENSNKRSTRIDRRHHEHISLN